MLLRFEIYRCKNTTHTEQCICLYFMHVYLFNKKMVEHFVLFIFNICFDCMVILSVLKVMSQIGSCGNLFGFMKCEKECACVFLYSYSYICMSHIIVAIWSWLF